ncbi:TetR family transcriptional regulator [Azospirillum sp. TSH100]|uniref:TetR/AcrR family transcriptional regulator n=1 Tax=Azospirillum sp. TSH100 TaxID=652764 RepID=UPI000D61B1BF|nr:TetR/AcrR family transcriptional regulator [Azospirillum sp. TSH100]PWC86906.1 TetR family transcriptional regulator [Azospirillum sp. TSH100]QCG91609.1 TetR/AcrR family transcriptional regulator [Azospirillum sp. TSH100]
MVATESSGSRGRRRSFDVDEAVETAMRLFHARGYDAVGVAELGTELGIKPPSFYAAFGSKAGLFERALQRYAAGEANIFARARAEGGGVAEVIERTLLLAARLYPERNGVAGCLVLDGARNSADAEACALAGAMRKAGVSAIRDFIAGEAPERADTLADFVTMTMRGMSAAARDGADEAALTAVAQMAGRAFRRELAAEG